MIQRHLLIILFIIDLVSGYRHLNMYLFDDEFELAIPQNRLSSQLMCKGCEKVLELAKQQLPNATKMAKKPLMMAIEAACKLYTGGIPLMAPLCAKMVEKTMDMLANRIIGNPKGIEPTENCKYIKLCSDC